MKQPAISPAFLALVCPSRTRPGERAYFEEQAMAIRIQTRHFTRLIMRPWEDWRMGYVMRWCSFCGIFDFWDLPKATVPPAYLRFEPCWYPLSVRTARALGAAVAARGIKPTPARIEKMAKLIQKALDDADYPRTNPGNSPSPVGAPVIPEAAGAVSVG